jgi:methionyl-tRNA formyltransferase
LLIFTDSDGLAPSTLIPEIARRVTVSGIVTSRPDLFGGSLRRRARRYAGDRIAGRPPRLNLSRFAAKHRIPLLVPPEPGPNDPAFLERLARVTGADVAVSIYCRSIFRRPLLDHFDQAVNFHNALLPRHRGLSATSFAIYEGDTEAGFTFHRMVDEVDAGPILVQRAVAIRAGDALRDVTARMVASAVAALDDVLERIGHGDPGKPQRGAASYHSSRDARAIVTVTDPAQLSATELARRLRAFGVLRITIAGATYPATRLRPSPPDHALAFRTAGGEVLRPDRFHGLPRRLYRARPGAASP